MGSTYEATCQSCNHHFDFQISGGMTFHYLHCDKCGAGKAIAFDELEVVAGEPQCPGINLDHNLKVECVADKCLCGGHFRFNAPVRFPCCHSTDVDWDEDNPQENYD